MPQRPLRGLLTAAALVIIVAGLRELSPILGPTLIAAMLTILCFPVMQWLRARGLPMWLALTATLLGVCAVAVAMVFLVGGSLDELLARLPQLQRQWSRSLAEIIAWLEDRGVPVPEGVVQSMFNAEQGGALAASVLRSTLRSLGMGFIIVITIVFMLTEASQFPAKLAAAFGVGHVATLRVGEVVLAFRRYIAIKTAMSIATGMSIGIVLHLLQIEFAVFWAFLAFLLNYIPSIGSLIAAVPAVLMVVVDAGWGWGAGVAAWYLVVNTVFGSLIEPKLQGEGLGLSPLVVFLSLFVWGVLLGPVGVLFSAPLTMMVKIAFDASPDLRWIAVLLGPADGAEPLRPNQSREVSLGDS